MRGENYKTSLTNFSMFCYYQSNIFKHVCTTKRKSNKTFICGIHCVKGHMFILKTCLKHWISFIKKNCGLKESCFEIEFSKIRCTVCVC